jgi:hypothetical protein
MMKNIMRLILILIMSGCNGQNKEGQIIEESNKDDMKKQPIERSEVHREYDEFGNLIKYDSIYSWSYSNKEGDSIQVNLDSIMGTFRNHFELITPYKDQQQFRYFPRPDSLFMHDFFKEDYYFKNWEDNQNDLEKMIRQMDSMRNNFLKDVYPGLMESEGQKHKKQI